LFYEIFRIKFVYEVYRTMENRKTYYPTESELEILQVIWGNGSATVREVYEALRPGRDTGYTTTLKTMQIMTEKGILCRDTTSRSHIYRSLVSKENTQSHFLDKIIYGLFSGSASRLVIGAIDNNKLSEQEIEEIREYLNKNNRK
jgi:BlaI family transcriptional regulator, penicillinase repressor